MDPLELQIIKHDGKAVTLKLAEKESVNHVQHALAHDGYLILKKATRPINSGDPPAEVLWNKFVKAILLASQDGKFEITRNEQLQVSHRDKRIGRDDLWKVMAENPGIVAMSCNHLGGDENTKWVIEIDRALRARETDDIVSVEANGLDIFLCNAWLRRSIPRPKDNSYGRLNLTVVRYLWKGFPISS